MTIWLLVLVMLASLAGIGYRQGAIRVGVSLFGILLAAVLAVPLGKLVRPMLVALWIKDPLLAWIIPPIVMFLVVSLLFKAGAAVLHQKIDVYYKYRAGDLRLVLWERLNQRLGLCLGLLNATIYLVLISFVIYAFGYWTVQMDAPDKDPKTLRILNRMARDLQATGFHKVARSIDGMPPRFYEMADVAGLVYKNPLLEARIGAYPGFYALGEMPQFKSLADDTQFIQMRQSGEPLLSLLRHPTIDSMITSPETLNTLWSTILPDLQDFRTFLQTGKSPKYDPELLVGRWRFNLNSALSYTRQAKPDMTSAEMRKVRRWVTETYGKANALVIPGQRIILKDMPQLRLPIGGGATPSTMEGKWTDMTGGKYALEFGSTQLTAKVDGDRMTVTGGSVVFVFDRTN